MANVSKIVGTYVIPIMVGAYCLFLWWDDQNFSDFGRRDILSRHYENLAELETIDGIIVGGSNAYYGISAGLISQKLDEDWYNASLIMEGFSYANYNSFLSDIAAQIDTANVNNVIYSTVLPYRRGLIANRNSRTINIVGKRDLSIKPKRSLISYLKMFALGEQVAETEPPPLPDKFGDIVFDDYECDLPLHNAFFEREEVDIGVSHLLRSIEFLVSVFPNASILVTLPGEYYGEDYVREIDEFENQIRSMFGLELAASSLYEGREVDLVFEPTFTDIEFMCNSKSHTNQRGRVLRTNDALQHLN